MKIHDIETGMTFEVEVEEAVKFRAALLNGRQAAPSTPPSTPVVEEASRTDKVVDAAKEKVKELQELLNEPWHPTIAHYKKYLHLFFAHLLKTGRFFPSDVAVKSGSTRHFYSMLAVTTGTHVEAYTKRAFAVNPVTKKSSLVYVLTNENACMKALRAAKAPITPA